MNVFSANKARFWVPQGSARDCWGLLGSAEVRWCLLRSAGVCRACWGLLRSACVCWGMLRSAWPDDVCMSLLGSNDIFWGLQGPAGVWSVCWHLLGSSGVCGDLLGSAGFCWGLLASAKVWLGLVRNVWLIIYFMYPGLHCCLLKDVFLNNYHNSLVNTQALGMEKYWPMVDRGHKFLPDT